MEKKVENKRWCDHLGYTHAPKKKEKEKEPITLCFLQSTQHACIKKDKYSKLEKSQIAIL